MGEFAIGQSVPRFEDPRLIQGGGTYIDDIVLSGMAFAHVLRSPHAHARIVSIDATTARAMPGVLLVLTSEDWAASGFGDMPVPVGLKRQDGSPLFRPPYPALVKDTVRWVGDHVAFVVAETAHEAADAAEAIEVEYEVLPAIVSTADAMSPDAPRVWPDCPDNVSFFHANGDEAATEAAFAKAHHIAKHRFVINRVTAVTMEPRGCVVDYHASEQRYTVHVAVQQAHTFRAELAQIAKVSESKVRVVNGDVGGSFGMKSFVYNETPLAMLAAKMLKRPVKWKSTRSEAFLSDAQGRDNVSDAELALDRDGNFLGLRVKTLVAVGAHLQTGTPNVTANFNSLAGVYKTPAIYVEGFAVLTHTPPIRPYRGNGRPEAAYVIERIIDVAADEMEIDPVELRRRNLIPPDAMPFKTGLSFTYDCGNFEANMDMALDLADVKGFAERRDESRKNGKLRGLGVSNSIERAGTPGLEGAEIRFDRSGAVTLFAGSVAHGQGHETIFKQIVCDKLGLDPSDVRYIQGDTEAVFFGQGTGGSRSATFGGSAFMRASERIIEKATKIAAHALSVDAGEVKFEDGIFSSPKTNRTMTIRDIARDAANPAKLPVDIEAGLAATAVYRSDVENFPNGTHVCEVEIDLETGKPCVVKYTVVDDVGTVLNPMLLHGQIHGGVVQGLGQILKEDINFELGTGQLLTGSFMDYAMPRASDLCPIHVAANPVPTKTNPLGVKGAGEAGSVGAMPAVANALVDALAQYGIKHIEMPATAERIWHLLKSRA
ncbi:carbon monoxide dehydrogenase large chain [Variibacter gotjawalensis]|uniref:Carbon monoxide dehydrogenase large chain n=1 Tax=Variibacter gotjawalensis TaxID=1333996 RepID=A0A0S3PWU8_9BRAD|nr:xanthine dehydrogenase family protein molybdopterin-binding subunit [Variibacter gotjawalensis]NIK46240.1 carbon-monoxide dehydrogenase large subunit [Variibacter gotjawalensis]RZS48156.1 xanthine dehydrogenase molybdenum binding subunit apoprotein [Variibacter gotjawalensis]BAT60413.1 carbon monoxide dehydrogenase large chain [Variibacter gotjawalensis]